MNFREIAKAAKIKQNEPNPSEVALCFPEFKQAKFSTENGIFNNVFDNSFNSDTSSEKRKKMSLSRMHTYARLNNRSTDETLDFIDSMNSDELAKSSFSEDRRRNVRVALKNRLQKIAEERLTIRQIFSSYVERSTLHGFVYACSDAHYIRRFIWAILMVIGAVYFLVKLKQGIIEYFEYPFSTLFTAEYVDKLSFPAISICLSNSLKFDAIQKNKLNILYSQNRLPLDKDWSDPGFDIPGDELVQLIRDSSYKIEDIFEDCDWIKRDTNHPSFEANICGTANFTTYFNNKGQVCFSLNSGKEGHELLEVDHEGLNHGYELSLNLHSAAALQSVNFSSINVVLHDQSEPPAMSQGFSVSPGFKTFVSLGKVETTNLPPPYATNCGEKKLKYQEKYNQKACLLELLTDYTAEKCNCRDFYMPDNGRPYCSLKQTLLCSYPARETFDFYSMRPKCPIDCEVSSYTYDLSDSRYLHNPPKGLHPALMENVANKKGQKDTHLLNLTRTLTTEELDHHIENNLINVIFFYHELKKDILEQEATFDFYQFLGDMGGEIGLMLGASLLTFVEFMDLFVFLVYHQLLRLHKRKEDCDEVAEEENK